LGCTAFPRTFGGWEHVDACHGLFTPRPNVPGPDSSGTTPAIGPAPPLSRLLWVVSFLFSHTTQPHHATPQDPPTMLRFARRSGGQHAAGQLATASLPSTIIAQASPALACGSSLVQTTWGRRHYASAPLPTKPTKSKLPYRPIHKLLVANRGTQPLFLGSCPTIPTTFPRPTRLSSDRSSLLFHFLNLFWPNSML
jgi:hypothetical protein